MLLMDELTKRIPATRNLRVKSMYKYLNIYLAVSSNKKKFFLSELNNRYRNK